MAIIGIDLGTTNSLVSVWKDNQLHLIPNTFGKFLTPSIVSVDEAGTVYVGEVAKERLISDPQNTAASFKRFMGSSKRFHLGGRSFSAEELSALVLQQLKSDAEQHLGEAVDEAVISVPAYFNDDQRLATKNSGLIAGLTVERLVNEPSAAALAGSLLFGKNDGMYLVIDLGGGTFDVSLVECFENVVSVISVSGDNHLGGIDFDAVIAKEFCAKNEVSYEALSEETQGILLKSAEKCKIALSHELQCVMMINTEQLKGSLVLTRKDFVELSGNLFSRLKKPMLRVLSDGGISIDEVDETILVGGGSKISVVNQFVEHILGVKPFYVGDPDELVARGVGIYAGIKERNEEIKQLVLTDICPFSLGVAVLNEVKGVEYNGQKFSPIIERNTVLPVSRKKTYSNARPFQTLLDLEIYQGEGMYVKDNIPLGKLEVVLSKCKDSLVEVVFTYDINGILEVEATVQGTNTTQRMTLLSESGKKLSEQEIEKKRKELAKLKTATKEEEQVRFMIEALQALYAHAIGDTREYIQRYLDSFQQEIKTQSRRKKAAVMQSTWRFIRNISSSLSYDLLGSNESETFSWYDEYLNGDSDNDDEEC